MDREGSEHSRERNAIVIPSLTVLE
jgi:hypothetical protein